MNYLIKRGSSYLLDLLIISIVTMIFISIMPIKNSEIDQKIDKLYEQKLEEKISTAKFLNDYGKLIKEKDIANIGMTFLNINLIMILFIIIPYYKKRTIGQSIMKLKLDGEVTIKNLLIRTVFVNATLYTLISLIFLITPIYFYLITIIAIIQIILVIKSLFMIIYRKDNLGLQDVYSKTKVVEAN